MSFRDQVLACSAIAACLAAPAYAQPRTPVPGAVEAGAEVEALVVTARRRDELVKDVPVAITAIGKSDIERYHIQSVDELARLAPGLQSAEGSVSSGGTISLRGVGSGSSNYLGDQAVSINVDGMQVGTLNIRKTAQIDMAQIEVLRGPQALFFGKNSPGGVISFKTADPTYARAGELSAGVEARSGDAYIQGIYSGPIADRVAVRLVGRFTKLNGYFNVKTVEGTGNPLVIPAHVDEYPTGDEYFVRATLLAEPTDQLKINAKLTYNRSEVQGGSMTTYQRVDCPYGAPQLQPAYACKAGRDVYLGGAPPVLTTLIPGSPTNNGLGQRTNDQVLATVQVDYLLSPNLKATSVTGYYWFDELNAHNASVGPRITIAPSYLPFEMKQFTQEVRLASDFETPVNFTVGAFYEHRTTDGAQGSVSFAGAAPVAFPLEGTRQSQEAFSAFGQLLWNVTDRLELSGGARYSHEAKDIRFFFQGADVTSRLATDHLSFDNLSPEVTGSYRVNDDVLVYASYKRGFKSGGFDAGFTGGAIGAAPVGTFRNTFAPEKVRGVEAGLKGSLGRVEFGATAYSYDYTDLQVGAFDAQTISFKVLNAAAARVRGVELEGQWRTPLTGLSLRGSLAYNDATFQDFFSACYVGQTPALGCNRTRNPVTGAFLEQDMSGRRLNNAPEVVGFGSALYNFELAGGWSVDLNLDAEYSSAYSANLRQSPGDLQRAFAKFHVGVRLVDADRTWEVAILARNLTNKYTFSASSPVTFTGSGSGAATSRLADTGAVVARGREVFARVARKF